MTSFKYYHLSLKLFPEPIPSLLQCPSLFLTLTHTLGLDYPIRQPLGTWDYFHLNYLKWYEMTVLVPQLHEPHFRCSNSCDPGLRNWTKQTENISIIAASFIGQWSLRSGPFTLPHSPLPPSPSSAFPLASFFFIYGQKNVWFPSA